MLISLSNIYYLGVYSACIAVAQQINSASTTSASSSSIDLTANSILNAAISGLSSTAASATDTSLATSLTASSTTSRTSSTALTSSLSSTTSTGTVSISTSTGLSSTSTSSNNVQPSSTVPTSSRAPTTTSETAKESPSDSTITLEGKVAIILGAVIGGIALLTMVLVLLCAFRRSRERRSYIRTDHLTSDSSSKTPVRSIIGRTVFPRGSANVSDDLRRSRTPSTKSQHRTSLILQAAQPNTSERALALGNIQESPVHTPLARSLRSPIAATYRPSGSPSRHNHRSIDITDVQSSAYSSDGSTRSRNSPFQPARPRRSIDSRSPRSPRFPPPIATTAGRSSVNFNRPFSLPSDGLKSPERTVSGAYFPAVSRQRSQVALVHYPSWSAPSEERDSDHFDESDGQQGSRERPAAAMSRRSGNWMRNKHEEA